MRTIFARKILRLHAAKIVEENVIEKKFMTFPIIWKGRKFESKTFKLFIGGSIASKACDMQGYSYGIYYM